MVSHTIRGMAVIAVTHATPSQHAPAAPAAAVHCHKPTQWLVHARQKVENLKKEFEKKKVPNKNVIFFLIVQNE